MLEATVLPTSQVPVGTTYLTLKVQAVSAYMSQDIFANDWTVVINAGKQEPMKNSFISPVKVLEVQPYTRWIQLN